MYKKILVPVDNSTYSNYAMYIAIELAKKYDSIIAGNHVYAANLHDNRFKEMEKGLPPKYQEENILEQSRKTHDSLITKGLVIISDSYLNIFEKRCKEENVKFERKIKEGKNYIEILKEIENNNYDLVIMGHLGLGATSTSLIGSTAERVIRKNRIDTLVVKNDIFFHNSCRRSRRDRGKILVAIDGSNYSFNALRIGITLAKNFESEIEAVTVFDPDFHRKTFQNLVDVLSDEAKKIFKFEEQEKLHDEIINKGLKKIYEQYLDDADKIAKEEKMEIKTTLLMGKPFAKIIEHIQETNPIIVVVGRFGNHFTDAIDLGSTTENIIRFTSCHVFVINNNAK